MLRKHTGAHATIFPYNPELISHSKHKLKSLVWVTKRSLFFPPLRLSFLFKSRNNHVKYEDEHSKTTLFVRNLGCREVWGTGREERKCWPPWPPQGSRPAQVEDYRRQILQMLHSSWKRNGCDFSVVFSVLSEVEIQT